MSTAFWKALYTSGHDAGFVRKQTDGWLLTGTAVYLNESKPVAVRYGLDLAADWSTRRGFIDGMIGTEAVEHRIERDERGWRLDGEPQHGLEDARDLDFGFTPATNHPQLKRMALQIGQSARITVAWFDLGCTTLSPLPQIYHRVSEDAYAYDSPQGPYQATLLVADNGFVRDYPELWQMELHGE
ncbi:putative glycolipid-binding domain-containing protein [Allosphingosinicella deserti]|uniref:putative glycolipid-binding domain-containing protein n=1 Tax=Allosphingosinicella deserti TaxID=2116704 RepID=UPI001304B596|nr:putative glycolipid-binding domain-containing protein [Sphingomonas deserti]